jgi:nitrogen-specific signal transduction histidine kinase
LQILDNLKTGVAIINHEWVYMYANNSYAHQMQMNCEYIIGQTLFELKPEAGTSCFFNHVCKHVMEERTPLEVETHYKLSAKPDNWVHVRVAPVPEGILIRLKDSTIKRCT